MEYAYPQPRPYSHASIEEIRASGCISPDVDDAHIAELDFQKYLIQDWGHFFAHSPDGAYEMLTNLAQEAHDCRPGHYAVAILKPHVDRSPAARTIESFMISRPVEPGDEHGRSCFRDCFRLTDHLHTNAWEDIRDTVVITFSGTECNGEKVVFHVTARDA